MAAIAHGLFDRKIATMRYQFPFMERGAKRVDSPAVAQATVRAATEAARRRTTLPLFAGGRSFGGRMTSQTQAAHPLEGVRGLIFFAYPLHAAGKPSTERAAHLSAIFLPMLFLQGSKDALSDVALVNDVVAGLGERASLEVLDEADHAFHVPARTGRRDAEVLARALDVAATWIAKHAVSIEQPS